jgi:anti-repressor protein
VLCKSTEQERHLKSMVCEVLTGFPSKTWRDALGKGVRDIFDTADLATYANAYSTAVCVLKAGKNRRDVRSILLPSFENRIDPHKYGVGSNGF